MPATVSGKVYGDSNHNGRYDPGEPGISNVYVVLCGPGGCSPAQTDPNGDFAYLVNEPGDYVLYEPVAAPAACPPSVFTQPAGYELSNGPRNYSFPITEEQIAENADIDHQDFGHDNPNSSLESITDPVQASLSPNTNLIPGQSMEQDLPSSQKSVKHSLSEDNFLIIEEAEASADVSIKKIAYPDPILAGEFLTYSLTIANAGPSVASQVKVTDMVPSFLLKPEFSIDNGISWNPWKTPYLLGDLPSQTTRTLLIRGIVQVLDDQTISNVASVSSSTPDPNSENNHSTAVVRTLASADLSITKSASPSPVEVGEIVTYTIKVTNAGPSRSQGITITDTDASSLAGAEVSNNSGTSWSPWKGSHFLTSLDPGNAFTLLVRGTVPPSTSENLTNTATVSSSTSDPNPNNNSITIHTPIENSADLSISKTASPNPVSTGQILTYALTVKNSGPSAAADVQLTDTIPQELTQPEFSLNGGGSWSPWVSPYPLGTLEEQAERTILIRGTVSPSAKGSFVNNAQVSSQTPDPNPDNNTASFTSKILEQSNLSISKTAWPDPAVPGQMMIYSITVTNPGLSSVDSIVLSDQVPDLLSQVEYTFNRGQSWLPWSGTLSLGTLSAGSSSTIFLRGILSAKASGTISNTAQISSSSPPSDPEKSRATVITPILISADLAVTKTASPNPAVPGQPLTYTLTVSNAGPGTAQNVVLSDAVANGEYSLDQGKSWHPWNGSYSLGDISANQSASLLIRVPVEYFDSAPIVNTAVVSTDTYDPNPENNRTTITVPKTPYSQLSICKCACQGVATPGQYLSYSITISNAGPGDAKNVVLTDQIPNELKNVQFSTDGGATWSPWDSSYSLGTLSANTCVTIWISGLVNAFSSGNIVNTATISSSTPDPNGNSHSSTAVTCICPPCGWNQGSPYEKFFYNR